MVTWPKTVLNWLSEWGAGAGLEAGIIHITAHSVKSSSSDSVEKEGENKILTRNLESLLRERDIWVETWRLNNIFLAERTIINHYHCQWKIKNRYPNPYVERKIHGDYVYHFLKITLQVRTRKKKNLWTKHLLLVNLER